MNLVAQWEEIAPFQVCCTDFTELIYANGRRKAYFMPILGHQCKVVFGWALSQSPNRATALQAWSQAKSTRQTYGLSWQGMIMHHDQDAVYTSYAWTGQLLRHDHVRLSYALNGARENPVMESFFARIKTEGLSRFLVADDLTELAEIVQERVDYYNYHRRHSSLEYQTPFATLQSWRRHVQGANRLSVDSLDNLGQVAHPDHRPEATVLHNRH